MHSIERESNVVQHMFSEAERPQWERKVFGQQLTAEEREVKVKEVRGRYDEAAAEFEMARAAGEDARKCHDLMNVAVARWMLLDLLTGDPPALPWTDEEGDAIDRAAGLC